MTYDGRALPPAGLGLIFIRARRKLGYRYHPHLFRHVLATKKAMDDESPSVLKRWIGHKNYAMTDYHFRVAEEVLGAIKPKSSVLVGVTMCPGIA